MPLCIFWKGHGFKILLNFHSDIVVLHCDYNWLWAVLTGYLSTLPLSKHVLYHISTTEMNPPVETDKYPTV